MVSIRELRERRGWSQMQLASELGVTLSTVYGWERGRHEPKLSQFRRLAQLFNVSMDEIELPDAPETDRQTDSQADE